MQKLNVIFLGGFNYPHGMAATKDRQHAIDGLKEDPEIGIRVVILRQSSDMNELSGNYLGTPYETVSGDLLRIKAILLSPLLHFKAKRTVRRLFQPNQKNFLLVYGPPSPENMPAIRFARRIGYKIVFDIVEDDDFAASLSTSLWHRVNTLCTRYMTNRIASTADGIVVISSHLEEKFRRLTAGAIPLHRRPILIQTDNFLDWPPPRFANPLQLFYAGSFSRKDGVPFLLDAFDQLARRHGQIRLVLTGKGNPADMAVIFDRIAASPFRDWIEYKGYLDDEAYFAALKTADIPCMTRENSGFANAGFPYKLGEFLATGKPVIASRVSDVAAMLVDRREAILIKPEDSGEIVAGVEYLIQNPEPALAIGRQGREKARMLFDCRLQGARLAEFLKSITFEKLPTAEPASRYLPD